MRVMLSAFQGVSWYVERCTSFFKRVTRSPIAERLQHQASGNVTSALTIWLQHLLGACRQFGTDGDRRFYEARMPQLWWEREGEQHLRRPRCHHS